MVADEQGAMVGLAVPAECLPLPSLSLRGSRHQLKATAWLRLAGDFAQIRTGLVVGRTIGRGSSEVVDP